MFQILGPEGQSLAAWLQALSNILVLFFIYWQLKGFRDQMSQADEQNRAERAWQFMHFYQQEIGNTSLSGGTPATDLSEELWAQYFQVRLRAFSLLNQLIRLQQVDERMLYGFLSDEFLAFTENTVKRIGQLRFMSEVSPRLMFLIATWGGEEKIYGPDTGGVIQSRGEAA